MKNWFLKLATSSLVVFSILANASQTNPKGSDWYLYVDVNAFNDSVLGDKLSQEANEGLSLINKLFGETVVTNTQSITLYGDMEPESAKVAIVQGNYNDLRDTIVSKLTAAGLKQTQTFKQSTIYYGTIDKAYIASLKRDDIALHDAVIQATEDGDQTTIYAAMTASNALVFSQSLTELHAVLADSNLGSSPAKDNMFEVVVDVNKSLLHGGMNLDDANSTIQFESISAQQIQQVSASYKENNGIAELNVGLKTADDATATRVQSVAKGLMALKILSEKDPEIVAIINDVQINQLGNELIVSLTATKERVEKLIRSFKNHGE